MDLKAAIVMLDTLVFAIREAVRLQDTNALILVTELFRAILAEGKDFTLQVLEHLQVFLTE